MSIARRDTIRDERIRKRFLAEADRFASDGRPWAVALVDAACLTEISVLQRENALDCLRLYLDGFLAEGELYSRVGLYKFALLLACEGDAFAQKLARLRQDAGFLFLASYPGKSLTMHVAACRMDEAKSAAEVYACAQSRLASDSPD